MKTYQDNTYRLKLQLFFIVCISESILSHVSIYPNDILIAKFDCISINLNFLMVDTTCITLLYNGQNLQSPF